MTPTSAETPAARSSGGQVETPPGMSRRIFRQITALEHKAASGMQPQPSRPPEPAPVQPKRRPPFRLHFMPAFWTITGLISLVINVILIVILLSLANVVLTLKSVVENQLVGGLASNFSLMDQARIKTNITVSTQVPARFSLPLETDTTVVLTQDTVIKSAHVTVTTGGLTITNALTNITLPAGTELPIHLNLSVPVDQQIPVNINVPVDIPLNQTDLHKPFVGLQNVVQPYSALLDQIPNSWENILCGSNPSDLCKAAVP
jgi:hypothetical protein